jgi:long-chain fatty acid transport protein
LIISSNLIGEAVVMFKKTIISGAVAALLLMAGSAAASGFALIEQSGSGLGNAFAGGAASAEDASTIFYNPAGMSRLSGRQLVVAASAIRPSMQFTNTASTPPISRPLGGATGDAGRWALVPNGYFAMEVNPKTRIGLGINAPFGLQTQYDPNWVGRFQAVNSKLQTLNLNPAVSYQMNDQLSVGGGLNYQQIKAELSSIKSFGALGEGMSTMNGSDAAWGYNLGALFDIGTGGRVGVSYRSSIQYQLAGNAYTASVLPIPGTNVLMPVTARIKTPDTLSISYFTVLNDKWDLMADLTRTGWRNFNELRIVSASTGATIALTPENWKDTWRVSAGGNFHYNERWTARAGVAFDQSPVSDQFRTARIPDGDRTWLSVGGQYKPNKQDAFDFGYAHLFVKNANINQNPAGAGNLVGTYANSVDILSVQYAHSF